ncbi:hypothetical protein MMC10_011303 [Thelotrema lepadinum]|nr:hypothetical protein [Thelotrema lepadinum]
MGRGLGQQSSGAAQPANSTNASGGGEDLSSASNNPSSPLRQLQFQEWYNPAYLDRQGQGNLFLIRPVLPTEPHGWFPATIFRPTIPVVSSPDGRSGLGDLNLVEALFPFPKAQHFRMGVGPTFTLPTATSSVLGQGKWQLGPASIIIYTGVPHLVIGALILNPISFAGESHRSDVNALTVQPLLVETFKKGYFIRTDGILAFDWERSGAGTIPVNLGVGKVLKIGSRPINAYVQPEWNVHYQTYPGAAPTPRFTLRLSVTLLYPEQKH